MKDPRISKLIGDFEVNGWEMIGEIDNQLEWWADFIIEFKSKWRPQGLSFYLTAVVDPMFGDFELDYRKRTSRKKGEGVWAIAISTHIPDKRHYKYIEVVSLTDLDEPMNNALIERLNDIGNSTQTPQNR